MIHGPECPGCLAELRLRARLSEPTDDDERLVRESLILGAATLLAVVILIAAWLLPVGLP